MNSHFPEALKRLRTNRGMTQAQLADALGIGKSTISMYEIGAREPDFEMLEAIADYFNVDMALLVRPTSTADGAGKELSAKDQQDIAHDLVQIMTMLESGGDLMFDGDPLSEEAKDSILSAMRLGLEAAKSKNKERFTPKKYRKE